MTATEVLEAEATEWTVTDPSVVLDMPNHIYHSDPTPNGSLSHSGAKTLINATPALFDYQRKHGRPDKRGFDLGHAAHDSLLGGGPEIVVVPDEITAKDGSWSTKEAKAFVAQVRARGAVPLHPEDAATVKAMATQLRAHPIASRLLDPERGHAEASAFWTDERTGITLRSRFDLLPNPRKGRMIIPDYKSTVEGGAARDRFGKTAMSFGYHMQAPFYSDGAQALGLAGQDVQFVFVVQEKTPPYLVNVIQLDPEAVAIGRLLNRRAIDLYVACTETNTWPGYPADNPQQASLPPWYVRQFEGDLA